MQCWLRSYFINFLLFMLFIALILTFIYIRKLNTLLQENHYRFETTMSILENKVHQIENTLKMFTYKSLPKERLSALNTINPTKLLIGKKEMQKHQTVFVGISRDNADEILNVMNHIEYIGEQFKDYKVVIFENDSTDNTKVILDYWATVNPKVKIISENYNTKKRPSIKFMADIRNKYLNAIKNDEYSSFDIVIPIDMDMNYGVDLRGLQHSFSKIEEWDVVCSNGIYNSAGKMWDTFAFRTQEFALTPSEYRNGSYWNDYLPSIEQTYSPNSDLVPVHSCFGGLAIYKRINFSDCFYDSVEEDCEHVVLHKCMRSKHNARIVINPAQITRYSHFDVDPSLWTRDKTSMDQR